MAAVAKRKAKKPKALRVKKLSSLLAIGLRDLRKQERAKDSVVQMNTWYECNGKCTACFAGCVLRFSMGLGKRKGFARPTDFDSAVLRQMRALDELRMGSVSWAKTELFSTAWEGGHRLDSCGGFPDYDGPNGEWWKRMRQLHADLVAAGE